MWDVIVLIPDHCLSIYFLQASPVHQMRNKTLDNLLDTKGLYQNAEVINKMVFCSKCFKSLYKACQKPKYTDMDTGD